MTSIIIAIFDSWFQWSMAILHHNNLGALFHDPIRVISGTLTTVVNFLRQVDFIVPIPTIFTIMTLNMSLTVLLWIVWFLNKGVNLLADVIP